MVMGGRGGVAVGAGLEGGGVGVEERVVDGGGSFMGRMGALRRKSEEVWWGASSQGWWMGEAEDGRG